MKHCAVFFLLIVLTTVMYGKDTVTPSDLVYLTESYPPFNYEYDGKLTGISIDILEAIWKKLDVTLSRDEIILYPWARGYNEILTRDNIVLFAMSRTKEREELFKWVGPYHSSKLVAISRKNKNIIIHDLEELKKYRLGVIRKDISEQMLVTKGFTQDDMIDSSNEMTMFRNLKNNRLDIVIYSDINMDKIFEKRGFKREEYEIVYEIIELSTYFAFSKNIPDDVIAQFQTALDSLKKDGTVERVIRKYQ